MSELTVAERATRAVLRVLGALPERAQRLIAGRPVRIDGQELFTEVQMALRLLNAMPGSSFEDLPLAEARAQIDAEARIFGGRDEVARIDEIEIPTRDGALAARVYLGDDSKPPAGAITYFHGGGWVVGSLDSTDSVCRYLAAHTDFAVVSVDYRLAPEHPFPAAVHDAVDAFRWVRDQGAWGDLVAVAGDSAGGNLAAAVCAVTLNNAAGPPDYQLLFFPVTDLSTKHPSYELFSDGFFLTEKQMDWYRGHYLSTDEDAINPLASPLLGDVASHPPAHVAVAGFDVLRDEGLAYAKKLEDAGVAVTTQLITGHIHAFTNATAVGHTSGQALAESVAAFTAGIAEVRRNRGTSK
ncbi:MAG TPA: alpha/beta hydrolase [Aeromicrobium sp.]|nr:alpha/beta hydrolase [Aeromicrobium sp.]